MTLAQLEVVFAKIMPEHLRKPGVADVGVVCGAVMAGVSASDHAHMKSSTDDVFRRLGGDG